MALRSLATLALVPLFALTAAAQDPATQPVPPAKAKPRNVLSTQPLSMILTVYNAEFERALGNTMTLALSASYWDSGFFNDEVSGDVGYTSGELKLRYYPSAKPFEGLSFAGSAGLTRVFEDFNDTRETETGPSIGTFLDYSWLLGPTNRFYTSVGIGAKAVFLDDREFAGDLTVRYPTARISVGFGF